MNPTLTKIIEDWIGIHYKLSIGQNDALDSALSDLRSRVPELVNTICEIILDLEIETIQKCKSISTELFNSNITNQDWRKFNKPIR